MRGVWMWMVGIAAATWVVGAGASPAPRPTGLTVTEAFAGGGGERGDEPWWRSFDDPALATIVERGLEGNGDLDAAWSRVEQARALSVQLLAPQLPSASFDLGANVAPFDSIGFQFGGLPEAPTVPGEEPQDDPVVYWSGSAFFNVRVPLDFWGAQLQQHRAGRFDAEAAAGDRDAQAISLTSQLGQAYFDAVAARAQVAILERQVDSGRALLELAELRYRQSDSSGLDVLQQRQQLLSTEALLPGARAQVRTATQRLAMLAGAAPGTTLAPVAEALPALPPLPATGTPTELATYRPDLRAASARMDAARVRRHASYQDFLPGLALTGQAGWQAIQLDEFDVQPTWGAGVTLSVPLAQGGARIATVQEARAAETGAVRSYDQLALLAIQEVESALALDASAREQLDALRGQLDAATAAYDESRARYAQGLTTYVTVLTALNAQQQAELGVLQAHRDWIRSRIQLHEALGGRWATATASR